MIEVDEIRLVDWLKSRYPNILSEFEKLGGINFVSPGVSLDQDSFTLTVDAESLVLSKNEFRLCRLLISDPGRTFSKEEISLAVWDSHYMHRIDDTRITKLVHRLRNRIPSLRRYLKKSIAKNYMGGYKLCLE